MNYYMRWLFLGFSLALPGSALGESSKKSLAALLARGGKVSEREAEDQVREIFGLIKSELKAGRKVEINNFGRFSLSERSYSRKKLAGGANSVSTKRRYTHFLASDSLKAELNPESD